MPVTNYYTANGQIYAEETNGVRTDYLTDPLGSVIGTMNAAGQLVNTYRYKPYGGLLAKTGNGPDPSFQWVGSLGYRQTGKKWSDVYVRARHCDTQAGRWTTRDTLPPRPLGYRYARVRPVVLRDPSGLVPEFGDGHGCGPKDKDRLKGCCADHLRRRRGGDAEAFEKAVAACVQSVFPASSMGDNVRRALGVMDEMCGDKSHYCVWCNPGDDSDLVKLGWPEHCRNDCGSLNSLGFTPVPGPTSAFPTKGFPPGCKRGTGDWPPECQRLAHQGGPGKDCGCVTALCRHTLDLFDDTMVCTTLYHEMVHCGRIQHKLDETAGRDFIYAIACCYCLTMTGGLDESCNVECAKVGKGGGLVPAPIR